MGVIELHGLRKEYRRIRGGRTVAVDGLDLEVPDGGVFGFLGPNGSGKTTTIRCVLGLARPTRGRIRLLGRPVPGGLHDAMRRVGAIDRIGVRRVDEVLGFVGLDDRAGDLVRKYSLGMRQRLALASTLLKD